MSDIILTSSRPLQDSLSFHISGSKSISQRVLIINYLMGESEKITNLSSSHDTEILNNCLFPSVPQSELNLANSGTSLRFLISLFALKNIEITLTGDPYLFNRPVTILIDYLNYLGANIYKENHKIYIRKGKLIGGEIFLKKMKTSQFISSLLLISPYLKGGLKLSNLKNIPSYSYVEMTISIMQKCGARVLQKDDSISVMESKYTLPLNQVESDWTSASYLFLCFLFSDIKKITISRLLKKSTQFDSNIIDLFNILGIHTHFLNQKIVLTKLDHHILPKKIEWDFTNNPDTSLTIISACFGLGIELRATGLETLAYKESDRIQSIFQELRKFDCIVTTNKKNNICIKSGENRKSHHYIDINTYNDHRIALCLSPLTLLGYTVRIDNRNIINKSYPNFFNDLIKFGVIINNKNHTT